MLVSEIADLKAAVGRKVRATREFAGIPVGTVGTIVSYYVSRKSVNPLGERDGIMVQWKTVDGVNVQDGFGRDAKVNETQWLEIVEEPQLSELPDPEKTGFEYKKTVTVWAIQIMHDFTVNTLNGPIEGKKGDYLLKGPAGDMWPCKQSIFESSYQRIPLKESSLSKTDSSQESCSIT